jgi:hypothetical protein
MSRQSSAVKWVVGVAMALAGCAWAAAPIVYPAKGQGAPQQEKDEGECYAWAKKKTGIDPTKVSAAPAPAGPAVGGGERVAGAVGGAVVGGLIGDSSGAAAGAAVGMMAGGAKARQKQKAEQQAAQAQVQGTLDTFNRAYGACLEGRGYTVK